jgi:hypothetical protein
MRMKAPTKTSARTLRAASLKRLVRFTQTPSTRMMFIAVFGVLGLAVLIGAATSDVHPEKGMAAAQKSAASPAAAHTALPAEATIVARGTDAASDKADGVQKSSAPVTLTGCLERDAETFRLKDTAGDNAPKSRSWKSGFLKKGSASIHVMDTANRMKLPSHVGQRVTVTGTLVDREMQVRSLQRVSASCGAKS